MQMAFLFAVLFVLLAIAGVVLVLVAEYRIYEAAGKEGWACLVPVYNIIVFLEIIGRPIWWIVFPLLLIVPFINFLALPAFIIIRIIMFIDLAKAFGKNPGWGVGMALLPVIVVPVFGFGKLAYQRVPGQSAGEVLVGGGLQPSARNTSQIQRSDPAQPGEASEANDSSSA
jgi:hypothetical protein